MNEDGSMAFTAMVEVAKIRFKIGFIEALLAYRMQHDSLIVKRRF
jgi:3,4-dihydroxy 2-butanone 4-phosphate synthase/GTP cyclohydrolase II